LAAGVTGGVTTATAATATAKVTGAVRVPAQNAATDASSGTFGGSEQDGADAAAFRSSHAACGI
jgi:hypothetical protein